MCHIVVQVIYDNIDEKGITSEGHGENYRNRRSIRSVSEGEHRLRCEFKNLKSKFRAEMFDMRSPCQWSIKSSCQQVDRLLLL